MNTLIFRTAIRFIYPLLLLFSVFLLLRGHDEPGGGFTGGLVAAAAFALVGVAHGASPARRLLRIEPGSLSGAGLALAIASGLAPMSIGRPFLTAVWVELPLPGFRVTLGTPLLFDLGVYLVVVGTTVLMVTALEEG